MSLREEDACAGADDGVAAVRRAAIETLSEVDSRDYGALVAHAASKLPAESRRALERDQIVTSAFIAADPYVTHYALPALRRATRVKTTFARTLALYARQLPRGKRVAQHFQGVGRFKFPSSQAWAAFLYHPRLIPLWARLPDAPRRLVPAPLVTTPD